MSRPLRIEYEDAFYHVINRGRGRQKIFHSDVYYDAFLNVLGETYARFGTEIHAYCLMGNHYHLLLKTPEGNLSRAMRHINGVYTQRYNRLRKTDGPLFRGRYKAILVDEDAYLLHLSKYIHLNPLKAKLVTSLAEYKWSSYPAYLGKTKCADWLFKNEVLGQLNVKSKLIEKYQAFVEDGKDEKALEQFYQLKNTPSILGDKAFREEVYCQLDSIPDEVPKLQQQWLKSTLDDVVEAVCKGFKVTREEVVISDRRRRVKNIPRMIAMQLGQELTGAKLTELAAYFGVGHYGTIAANIYQVKKITEDDKNVGSKVKLILQDLTPFSYP